MKDKPDAQVFLLSPAYCAGRRAAILLNPTSSLPIACRLRAGALTLGDAFAFLSGLYFRGKLAYATKFQRAAPSGEGGLFVMTPTCGLQAPGVMISVDRLREFAEVDIHEDEPRYRTPLDRDVAALAARLPADTRVVLLGSIATGKYVQALTAELGARLHFPVSFVGRGDMSRGGLLLRSVRTETELEYAALHADTTRHGTRPAKLPRP